MSRTNSLFLVAFSVAVLFAAGMIASVHSKAVAASSDAYSWVAYGDIRPGSGATNSAYSAGWTHVRDRIAATPHAFDVVPGDLIQGLSGTDTLANDLAKYDWLATNMGAEQSVPKVYAPGNHENFASASYRSAWEQKINAAHWRAFSYGAGTAASPRTYVISLSTEEPGYTGRIGLAGETSASNSPQAKWLVSTLQREAFNANEYVVVEFHRPVADPKPGESMSDQAALESLFAKYGVDLVINAHVHVYARHMMPNGTPYLICGNGGASLYGEGSWSHTTPGTDVKSVVGSYGYAAFTVRTDGTVAATVYAVDPATWAWSTADSFTVPQTAPTAAGPGGTPTPTTTQTASPTPTPTSSPTPAPTPTVTLKLRGIKSGVLTLGKRVTAKGLVSPASLAGDRVVLRLRLKRGTEWVKARAASTLINSTGAYRCRYKPKRKGAYRVQAVIVGTASHTSARSGWRTFKVK